MPLPPPIDPAPVYRTQLDVLFASEAPIAVLLRRGPRRRYRLICWKTDADTFDPGQFLAGEATLCDLAPNGRKLLTFIEQYRRPRSLQSSTSAKGAYEPLTAARIGLVRMPKRANRKVPRYLQQEGRPNGGQNRGPLRRLDTTWTAISTPPYFSALAIWPALGTWTGGGVFLGNATIQLREDETALVPVENVPCRGHLYVLPAPKTPGAVRGAAAIAPLSPKSELYVSVSAALAGVGFRWFEWVATHAKPDLLFAADGCIYRLRNWSGGADPAELQSARMIADFRDMPFETIAPPPEAMQW